MTVQEDLIEGAEYVVLGERRTYVGFSGFSHLHYFIGGRFSTEGIGEGRLAELRSIGAVELIT